MFSCQVKKAVSLARNVSNTLLHVSWLYNEITSFIYCKCNILHGPGSHGLGF